MTAVAYVKSRTGTFERVTVLGAGPQRLLVQHDAGGAPLELWNGQILEPGAADIVPAYLTRFSAANLEHAAPARARLDVFREPGGDR